MGSIGLSLLFGLFDGLGRERNSLERYVFDGEGETGLNK